MSHRTMRDFIEATGLAKMVATAHSLTRRLEYYGDSPRPYFRCECGRLVDTEQMLDLIPDTVPALLQLTPAIQAAIGCSQRFRCDGCWTHWVRTQKIDKNVLRAATGQPPTTKVW